MSGLERWSSLADEIMLAARLYDRRGDQMVAAWLDRQLSLVGNTDFAHKFADHAQLPGVSPLEFAHRHLRAKRGELLGGIRFYARNTARPFVDVLAHSFDDMSALADCVSAEWSIFAAPYLRLLARPGRIAGPNVLLDQSIHVGRYCDMQAPDGRIQLHDFNDVGEAIDIVAYRYQHLAQQHPELADLSPPDADDLRRLHADGQLRAIRRHESVIGVLGVAPGSIGWITGDQVEAEVIAQPYSGHGYAASAQTAWAAYVAVDPEQFLIGTIDRQNDASRRTALRAGRPSVLDYSFVALRPPK